MGVWPSLRSILITFEGEVSSSANNMWFFLVWQIELWNLRWRFIPKAIHQTWFTTDWTLSFDIQQGCWLPCQTIKTTNKAGICSWISLKSTWHNEKGTFVWSHIFETPKEFHHQFNQVQCFNFNFMHFVLCDTSYVWGACWLWVTWGILDILFMLAYETFAGSPVWIAFQHVRRAYCKGYCRYLQILSYLYCLLSADIMICKCPSGSMYLSCTLKINRSVWISHSETDRQKDWPKNVLHFLLIYGHDQIPSNCIW